ncbi:unnamed protein product [Prunus armeniaca]
MFLEPSRTLQLLRRLRAFWSLGMSVTPRLKPEVASSFNGKLNLLVLGPATSKGELLLCYGVLESWDKVLHFKEAVFTYKSHEDLKTPHSVGSGL